MNRRSAIRNVGFLSGGIFLLPYACETTPELIYSNFPLIKRKEQNVIGQICNLILAEDPVNFPTPEKRVDFVLTMINDCGSPRDISFLTNGLNSFLTSISPEQKIDFSDLLIEEQNKFIGDQLEEKSLISDFLNLLKRYSILHFKTSENYLTQYLKFEFMPGRYLGRVAV
jgi:hypothetical protein